MNVCNSSTPKHIRNIVSIQINIFFLLQQHQPGVNSAMLHTNPGGQGDAMLSAINMNTHKQDTAIQVCHHSPCCTSPKDQLEIHAIPSQGWHPPQSLSVDDYSNSQLAFN